MADSKAEWANRVATVPGAAYGNGGLADVACADGWWAAVAGFITGTALVVDGGQTITRDSA